MTLNEKDDSPGSSATDGLEQVENNASVGGYGVGADTVPRDKLNAMFENPLAGIPRNQLFADVDKFCNENNLSAYNEVFRKGALVAQNPSGAQDLDILNQADKHILEREHTHKWSHPKQLYYLVSKSPYSKEKYVQAPMCGGKSRMQNSSSRAWKSFFDFESHS